MDAVKRIGAVALLAGCAGGEGAWDVVVWGDRFIPEGATLDDGWRVDFDHWVTAVGDLTLSDPKNDEPVASTSERVVVDLVVGDEIPLAILDAPAGRFNVGYVVAVPAAGDPRDGSVDAGLVDEMIANGWAHRVIGSASKDGLTVRFDLGLDLPSRYTNCVNGLDRTEGVSIDDGQVTSSVLTMHGEHLLWTAVGTEESATQFGLLAGLDADNDGLLTNAEVAAADAVALGFETAGIVDTVYDFLAFSVAQGMHLNGEGVCVSRSL